MSKKVTVIIPAWNSHLWLSDCLDSLEQQTYSDFETILINNGSTDNSFNSLKKRPNLRLKIITFETNRGFTGAVNAGIKQAQQTDYIVLLNVDTRPEIDWLEHLIKNMDSSPADVGSIASKMLVMENPNLIDDAGDSLSWYGSAYKRGHKTSATGYNRAEEIFSACAGAALYRREFFTNVGLFDERFNSYFEDVDLGLRGRIYGYRCLYAPKARVLHHGHSAGIVGGHYTFLMTRNRLITILKNIPAYLLLKHWYHLLWGQFYFFLVYKNPLHSLKGYLYLLFVLPHILKERKKILPARVISIEALDNMLSSDLNEPTLSKIIGDKIRRFYSLRTR